jgi:hypothetical protein
MGNSFLGLVKNHPKYQNEIPENRGSLAKSNIEKLQESIHLINYIKRFLNIINLKKEKIVQTEIHDVADPEIFVANTMQTM